MRIVVIGAGVGGLTAAVRLAELGHRVTVFESAGVAGGKLGRYERDGFAFDTGPSLLTLPQLFDGLNLDLVRLDPVVRHVFPDGAELDSSSSHPEFLARIATRLGPDAAADWERLWRRAARIWAASWDNVLQRPVDSPLDLAGLAWRLGDLTAIAPGRTLRGLGRSYLRDPRLRMLLDRYATYTGADPRRAPAALLAVPYAELAFGGWYVRGGLHAVAEALVERCRALGVTLELGAPVARITVAGGRATGVTLASGTTVAADAMVSNVDALTLYRTLLPTPSRLAGLAARSLAGFVLLLGVRGDTPRLAHHTVFFPPDYDAEFDAVFAGRPPADPTVFVTRAADDTVHPPGHEAWFVLVNAPRHGLAADAVDWRRPGLADAYADRVLDVLAARGLDVRDRIVFREVRTPADLAASTGAPGGAIYGTAGGLLRPPNRGPVGGLHLVGGSTHPGGGLPMVTLSARIVADRIGPA